MTLYRDFREAIKKTQAFKIFEHFVVNSYFKYNYGITQDTFENNLIYSSCPKNTVIDGIPLTFYDIISSNTVETVSYEINTQSVYDFSMLNFNPNDVVIDIGANIGIVSIYLAKKFPFLKIYAFEPVPQNYFNFKINLDINNIPEGTISAFNMGVTADARPIHMNINKQNSGASFVSDLVNDSNPVFNKRNQIETLTFTDIYNNFSLNNIKLLKIDCEGSEYEILKTTSPEILNKIEIIRGEFHENKLLEGKYDIETLLAYIKKYVKNVKVEKCYDNCLTI